MSLKLIEAGALVLSALAFFSHYGKLTLGAALDEYVSLYQTFTQGVTDLIIDWIFAGGLDVTPEESDLLWFNGLLFLPIFREGVAAARRVRSAFRKFFFAALALFYVVVYAMTLYGCVTDTVDADYLAHVSWYDYGFLMIVPVGMGTLCAGAAESRTRTAAPVLFLSHYVAAVLAIWGFDAIGALELNLDPFPFRLSSRSLLS